MKILDRYIARQLLGVTALGVMALSALLLLGNLFKELRPLLVENKAPISIVLEFIFQVIPFSLMFSIPWGFLTAVLLVYGRLASDNELTSMRMSGMSLWRLSAPAIAIGIALSGLCYWINIDIAPRAKQSISELLIKAASINPKGLLNEGQAITKFDNLEIYIDKRADDVIHGMHIYQKADEKSPSVAMHSERVTMDFSPEKKILTLNLINPLITTQEEGSISQSVTMDEMPLSINLDKSRSRRIKANRFTNREIREALDTPGYLDKKQTTEFATELPRRASFSLACIVFALIGVPLAINTRRKDTSTGFAAGSSQGGGRGIGRGNRAILLVQRDRRRHLDHRRRLRDDVGRRDSGRASARQLPPEKHFHRLFFHRPRPESVLPADLEAGGRSLQPDRNLRLCVQPVQRPDGHVGIYAGRYVATRGCHYHPGV